MRNPDRFFTTNNNLSVAYLYYDNYDNYNDNYEITSIDYI
jgi:hypothetical protein